MQVIFVCPFLHKYTYDGGGCQTEYVWGICMDLTSRISFDSEKFKNVAGR
jgi:hypothetical protein